MHGNSYFVIHEDGDENLFFFFKEYNIKPKITILYENNECSGWSIKHVIKFVLF